MKRLIHGSSMFWPLEGAVRDHMEAHREVIQNHLQTL